MKPTEKQIADEIAKLKTQIPSIPPSAFGDDNQGAARAQLDVLEARLGETAIYTKYDEPEFPEEGLNQQEEHCLNAALDAGKWLRGESKESPSQGWAPIIGRLIRKINP